MSKQKWDDNRTSVLVEYVGDESPVSTETVAGAAEELEVSVRSIASKLRKMGYDVEKASARAARAFTEEEETVLGTFVTDNSGEYTYAEIASTFADGKFTPKQIQGKILSMELTEHVKPAPKPEAHRSFTEKEEATFVEMANGGSFLEEIAEALKRELNVVRGKALSLLKAELIARIPTQRDTKAATRKDGLAELGDVSEMTVEEIAEAIEKTPRGVKTMLTRRGLVAKDYDGAARKAKAESNA